MISNPVAAALQAKIITFTKDLAEASCDSVYTGVGFKPTLVFFFTQVRTGTWWAQGFFNELAIRAISKYNAGENWANKSDIEIIYSDGHKQNGVLKSIDSDGFTLTWTQTGGPTGSQSFYCLCIA